MPHLMNMSRYPLSPWIHPTRCRILQKGVADLCLCYRDAGVLEEEVREGHDSRGAVDEGYEERDEDEEEARAGLHLFLLGAYRGLEGQWLGGFHGSVMMRRRGRKGRLCAHM
jgi:hypothetical protein